MLCHVQFQVQSKDTALFDLLDLGAQYVSNSFLACSSLIAFRSDKTHFVFSFSINPWSVRKFNSDAASLLK